MKWIRMARKNRKTNRPISALRGSNSVQTFHMSFSSFIVPLLRQVRDELLSGIHQRRLVAVDARQPRTPRPHQDVGDNRDTDEHDGALGEDLVEFLCLVVGQTRWVDRISHS